MYAITFGKQKNKLLLSKDKTLTPETCLRKKESVVTLIKVTAVESTQYLTSKWRACPLGSGADCPVRQQHRCSGTLSWQISSHTTCHEATLEMGMNNPLKVKLHGDNKVTTSYILQ